MSNPLEFEAPVHHLQAELERLEPNPANERRRHELEASIHARLADIYSHLTPWQRVMVARHPDRPHTLDFVRRMCADFVELHGDRRFGDDGAIVGGPAVLNGTTIMLVGHQKGRDTRENLTRSFGMPNPEGYRKAIRLFKQAEKLRIPVVTLIDTPGANPTLPAEERGQAQAIAESIAVMLALRVPTVAVVTGEGGSGGALAIAVADRILMFEHSIFTVASPEAAASILWRDAGKKEDAAALMRITAPDLMRLGVIDQIVPEPLGGSHRDHGASAAALQRALMDALTDLSATDTDRLLRDRHAKYRRMGTVMESPDGNSYARF